MDTAIQNLKIGFVKVYEDVYTRHVYSAPKKKAKSEEPAAAAAAANKKVSDSNLSSSHNSSKGNNDYEDMEVVRGVLEIVTSAAVANKEEEDDFVERERQPDAAEKEEDGERLDNPDEVEQLQPTYREQMNQAFRESFFGIQRGDQQESSGTEVGTAGEKGEKEKEEAAAMSDTPTETLDVTIELPETSFANGTGGDGEEGDEDERTIPDYDEYDDERLDEEEIEDYNWDEVLDEAGRPATFLILQKLK